MFSVGRYSSLVLVLGFALHVRAQDTWTFAVSGDSRNCGDVVMPAIAAGAHHDHAAFYWHLGDLRAIYDFDQDYRQLITSSAIPPTIIEYENRAWNDAIENQITPFGEIPFFIGMGNHETIPPKTRAEFLLQFADWLDTPELQQQRLKDNPKDHRLHAYYHWRRGKIDFINLDNASTDQFDRDQLAWFDHLLQTDAEDTSLATVVVGMHEALPDSISIGHSMNESAQGESSGRHVYAQLLELQKTAHKNVYVLASHSHFFMEGIYNTDYWRSHGGVLPGWIVGTAGAVRYPLPPAAGDAKLAKTGIYGYLLGSAGPDGRVDFRFHEIQENDIPAEVLARFGKDFVHSCFALNRSN